MIPDQNNQPPLSEHERIEQLNEPDLQKITRGCLSCGTIATVARYEAEVLKEHLFQASSLNEAGQIGGFAWSYKKIGEKAHNTSRLDQTLCGDCMTHLNAYNKLQEKRGQPPLDFSRRE